MSHKSYRPLTVLSFRLARQAWSAAPATWRQHVQALRASQRVPYEDSSVEAGKRGVDPLLFHASNVLWHALASALVCRLAYFMLRRRWRDAAGGGDAPAAGAAGGSAAPHASANGSTTTTTTASAADSAAAAAATKAAQPADVCSGAGAAVRPSQAGLRQRLPPAAASAATNAHGRQRIPVAVSDDDDDDDGGGGGSGAESDDDEGGDAALARAQAALHLELARQAAASRSASAWARLHAPAWFAGLAFALHPVHTEAVAGVVGHAELLCCVLCALAFMAYLAAAEGSCFRGWGAGAHWAGVAAAVALAWAGTLAKEVGMTVFGAMALADVMMVPLDLEGAAAAAVTPPQHDEAAGQEGPGGAAAAGKEGMGGGGGRSGGWIRGLCALGRERKWARLGVLCAAGAAYVQLRAYVAGDQLVRIYRKVENPIAFLEDYPSRLLSTAHLHSRYAGLLLAPAHLSADWSHACVPLVTRLGDPRNAAAAALYAYLLAVVLLARPWSVPLRWLAAALRPPQAAGAGAGGAQRQRRRAWGVEEEGGGVSAARWRLVVAVGLLVGPFFPASNVLFYVGTFIAERLLYMPSVGFCLLAAEALACALDWCARQEHHQQQRGGAGVRRARARAAGTVRPALGLAVVALLSWYAVRTWRRNGEWRSEEALFTSALRVCPNSAKVRLNMGILMRRKANHAAAAQHFRAAKALEPTYCEPDYWLGISLINMGETGPGLEHLEAAVSCKYVAADAVSSLNTIYSTLHRGSPKDPTPITRWSLLLLRPELRQLPEGCDGMEQAALAHVQALAGALAAAAAHSGGGAPGGLQPGGVPPGALAAASQRTAQEVSNCLAWCVQALAGALEGRPEYRDGWQQRVVRLDHKPSLEASQELLRTHQDCVNARYPVYLALLTHGSHSPQAKVAAYDYLERLQADKRMAGHCRRAAAAAGLPPAEAAALHAASPSPHISLMHLVQSVDPEDPWLQHEWGHVMALCGRAQEAALHFSVAGMLLQRQLQHLAAGERSDVMQRGAAAGRPGTAPPHMRPTLTAEDALQGAADAFEQAALLRPDTRCELWGQALEARWRLVAALGARLATEAISNGNNDADAADVVAGGGGGGRPKPKAAAAAARLAGAQQALADVVREMAEGGTGAGGCASQLAQVLAQLGLGAAAGAVAGAGGGRV